jgi:hypothetical protein
MAMQWFIDTEDAHAVWKFVGFVSLGFSAVLLFYTLQFLRNTLPSQNPLSVVARGGEWRYFLLLFTIFLFRYILHGNETSIRARNFGEVLL